MTSPTPEGQRVAYRYLECPSDDECAMCANEACNKCGAGCWSRVRDCEHDVVERHELPTTSGREGERG